MCIDIYRIGTWKIEQSILLGWAQLSLTQNISFSDSLNHLKIEHLMVLENLVQNGRYYTYVDISSILVLTERVSYI